MMPKNIKIIVLLICFLISSFEKIFSQENITTKDWTLMLYVAADNNLDPFAELDLKELIKFPIPSNINVIVQIDKSEKSNWGDWSTCRRIDLGANKDFYHGYIEDIGEINTGDQAELTKFIDWTIEKYPANKYGLIIWNHGDGWRDFRSESNPNERKPIFKSVANDDGGDALYMNEISNAIKNCKNNFSNKKFEFIGFDACLMNMLEVWYEIKSFSKFGIGSQDLEPGNGWSYEKLPSILSDEKTNNIEKFSKILNNYKNSCANRKDNYTLSLIDLSKIDTIAKKISTLSEHLLKYPSVIQKARSNTLRPYGYLDQYSWPNGIDLKNFLLNYKKICKDKLVNSEINTLTSLISSTILFNVSDPLNTKQNGSFGLSIYFPIDKSTLENDPEGKAYSKENINFPNSFVQEQKWDIFLNEYYGKIKKKK